MTDQYQEISPNPSLKRGGQDASSLEKRGTRNNFPFLKGDATNKFPLFKGGQGDFRSHSTLSSIFLIISSQTPLKFNKTSLLGYLNTFNPFSSKRRVLRESYFLLLACWSPSSSITSLSLWQQKSTMQFSIGFCLRNLCFVWSLDRSFFYSMDSAFVAFLRFF